MELVKVKDGVDTPVEELVTMQEEQVNELLEIFGGATFAEAGGTSGTTVDLTPGRWIYACLITQGSVNGTQGTGPPHAAAGMLGDLIVT